LESMSVLAGLSSFRAHPHAVVMNTESKECLER